MKNKYDHLKVSQTVQSARSGFVFWQTLIFDIGSKQLQIKVLRIKHQRISETAVMRLLKVTSSIYECFEKFRSAECG